MPPALTGKMDRCVRKVMAEGKDEPTAIAICYTSVVGGRKKAANYGARAGQTIAGNLGRGSGGRFARAGSGAGAAAPKPGMSADMSQDFGAAVGLPAGTLDVLNGMKTGRPVTAAQAQALVAAGLAKEVDGGIVMTRAARSVLAASKRGDIDAARAAIDRAKPKPKAPKGGGGGKAPKPTAEQRARERQAAQDKNFLAAARDLGIPEDDLAADFLQFARGGKQLAIENAELLTSIGIVDANDDGSYSLSQAGRNFVNAALRGDKRASQDAAARARRAAQAAEEKRNAGKPSPVKDEAMTDSTKAVSLDQKIGNIHRAFSAQFGQSGPMMSSGPWIMEVFDEYVVACSGDKFYRASYAADGDTFTFVSMPEWVEVQRKQEWVDKAKELRQAAGHKSLKDRVWETIVGLFNPEETAGLGASFKVLKQADGSYRWVAISSNSYLDRDGEIISQKALEDDVARADSLKSYGPLLWWHEPGIVLGDCDFNAMSGRMLVESGTFKNARIGEAFANAQKDLGVSIGFRHPHNEPDADGVFKTIRRFERSPLPLEVASNPYTAFTVTKGKSMDDKKRDALAALIGEDAVKELVATTQTQQKQNDDAGVRTKETETPATPDKPADPPAAAGTDAEAEPFVGDLRVSELATVLAGAIGKAMEPVLTALKEQSEARTKEAGDQSAELATTKEQLTAAEAKVKQYETLIGELPRAQQRQYRPIGDQNAQVDEKTTKEKAPAADEAPRSWLYGFVAGQPGENGAGTAN